MRIAGFLHQHSLPERTAVRIKNCQKAPTRTELIGQLPRNMADSAVNENQAERCMLRSSARHLTLDRHHVAGPQLVPEPRGLIKIALVIIQCHYRRHERLKNGRGIPCSHADIQNNVIRL